jgi:hypothetical protein
MPVDSVGFEISDQAEEFIRARGGELWIWPREDRKAHAANRPPAFHQAEWTTHTPDGLVIRVDSTIEPPECWVLATVGSGQWVVARWNGRNAAPGVSDELPLAGPREEPATPQSSPLAHVRPYLLVPMLAWVVAVLWALRFVGVNGHWLSVARTGILLLIPVVAAVIAAAVWLRENF